jgi:hypothetical protein
MRLLAALFICISTWANAAGTGPDNTDIWYNPGESGWGLNVVQQGNTMFITIFVYGPNNQPVWYVAPNVVQSGSGFSGALYRASGPYFGAATFTGAAVTPVGNVTFSSDGTYGSLLYSVDGVVVSKLIYRNSFSATSIAGTYVGGSTGVWSPCEGARPTYIESPATYTITQTGTSVQILEEGAGFQCTHTGDFWQHGRSGTISAQAVCSGAGTPRASFEGSNVVVTDAGINMNIVMSVVYDRHANSFCVFNGRLGGIRRAQ